MKYRTDYAEDGLRARILETADDVTEGVLADAEMVYDGWFADAGRIDWELFIDRLAETGLHSESPYDFELYDSPAVSKVQRHVRELRRSA